MNGKQQAMQKIEQFLKSEEHGILITGTHQYDKHVLAMEMIEEHCKNTHILFRINSLQNITNDSFLCSVGVTKQPKAGEQVQIGRNYYEFDSLYNRGTWLKTSNKFDFVIIYPIDYLVQKQNIEPVQDIFSNKTFKKIFLCSWTDGDNHEYPILIDYYNRHVIYDAEEDDPAYHKRVLKRNM